MTVFIERKISASDKENNAFCLPGLGRCFHQGDGIYCLFPVLDNCVIVIMNIPYYPRNYIRKLPKVNRTDNRMLSKGPCYSLIHWNT